MAPVRMNACTEFQFERPLMNRELSCMHVPRLSVVFALLVCGWAGAAVPQMLYADTDNGRPFAKDPDVVRFQGRYLMCDMFYAGAYNNQPQQIGCAVSDNGIVWQRLSELPLLPNGKPGTWNSSESGHPGIFTDHDGRMYLFFQGNKDRGKTWYLSKMQVQWSDDRPYLVRLRDGVEFHLQ